MPDLFDQLEEGQKADIFNQLEEPSRRDIFDSLEPEPIEPYVDQGPPAPEPQTAPPPISFWESTKRLFSDPLRDPFTPGEEVSREAALAAEQVAPAAGIPTTVSGLLPRVAPTLEQFRRFTRDPYTSEEEVPTSAVMALPPTTPEQAAVGGAQGVEELAQGLADFFTSPSGIALLGLTMTPLAPAVAIKFAYDMIQGGMINAGEAYDAYKRGDIQALAKHATVGAGLLIGGGGIVKHGVTRAGQFAEGYLPRGVGEPIEPQGEPGYAIQQEAARPVRNLRQEPIQGAVEVPAEVGGRTADVGGNRIVPEAEAPTPEVTEMMPAQFAEWVKDKDQNAEQQRLADELDVSDIEHARTQAILRAGRIADNPTPETVKDYPAAAQMVQFWNETLLKKSPKVPVEDYEEPGQVVATAEELKPPVEPAITAPVSEWEAWVNQLDELTPLERERAIKNLADATPKELERWKAKLLEIQLKRKVGDSTPENVPAKPPEQKPKAINAPAAEPKPVAPTPEAQLDTRFKEILGEFNAATGSKSALAGIQKLFDRAWREESITVDQHRYLTDRLSERLKNVPEKQPEKPLEDLEQPQPPKPVAPKQGEGAPRPDYSNWESKQQVLGTAGGSHRLIQRQFRAFKQAGIPISSRGAATLGSKRQSVVIPNTPEAIALLKQVGGSISKTQWGHLTEGREGYEAKPTPPAATPAAATPAAATAKAQAEVAQVSDDVTWKTGAGDMARATVQRISQYPNETEPMADVDWFGLKRVPVSQLQIVKKSSRRLAEEELAAKAAIPPVKAVQKAATEVRRVAKTEGQRSAKEIKADLVQNLEKALETAPDARITPVTEITTKEIRIPGDGDFTVFNTKQAIGQALSDAKKISTTSGTPPSAKRAKIDENLESQAEAASKAYGSAERAYTSIKRQRDALQNREPERTKEERKEVSDQIEAADALLQRVFENTEAGKLDSRFYQLESQIRDERDTHEQIRVEINRLERRPSRNARDKESLAYWNEREVKSLGKIQELTKQQTEARRAADAAKAELEQGLEPPKPPETPGGEGEHARTETGKDPFERARAGEEKAFDDLDDQFRETYPEPEELEIGRPNPNQAHTPQQFAERFNKAYAVRDFDTILDTIKATSDVSVWKPFLQDLFKRQAKDPIAADKAEWMRHVFNGTRPSSAIPRPPPKPSTPRPPTPSTPPPRPSSGPAPPPRTPPTPPSPPPVRIPVDPIPGGGGKSPYRIIEDFSAAIGKAIRVLRMKKSTLGTYRPGTTGTAERFAGDLDTAAHELAGHWTDDKYGIGKPWIAPKTRSPYDAELAKFWIHGSVTPRSTLRYRRAEGIAEFIRAYVVNPKQAKLEAPTFAAYFERTLPKEALKAINDFGTDVRRWAGEDPLVRAGLNIRMEPPSLTERLWKGFQGRGFGFEINPLDRLRLWFDDPYHYAVKAFHKISELRGTPVKPRDNFELLSRLLATHDSRMADQFERGLVPLRPTQSAGAKGLETDRLIDPKTNEPMTLKWLVGAFDRSSKEAFNQDMRDASAYMVAQRTIEKGAQLGKERVSGIGAGIMTDKQAAQELLNRVAADPARKARLDEAARRYRLWADQNLNLLKDSGRLSAEQVRKIREDNQQYVDMHRLSEEFETGFRQQRGGGIGTTRDVIKRFKGSTLELDNVYTNLLEQTDSIQREAHRNVTMRSFTDGLTQTRELHGPNLKDFDQFGRKVTSADRNTITVYDNGKPQHWQFDPEIYDSLKGLGELGSHAFIDLLALPSRLARYLITHGPQFIIRNPLRDTFERSVTSRSGGKPWDVLGGYTQAELSRYEVFGGGQFGNYIVDRHAWNRELKRVQRELTKDPTNIFLSPLKLKHGWEALAEKSEKLGRVAEFRRAFERGKKELGYDDYDAALYAAGEARGLLDFAKAGTVMRHINKLVPFSNARVRGLARAAFGFKENPARFAMRWGMFVLVPTIANMLWNRQDKETWDEYQQLPAYQKDFFWNFKVGPYWLRIPKPHELGVMAGGVERAVNRMLGEKHSLEGWPGSVASAALPVSTPVEGTGPLKTLLELEFNRDTFRNRDIIPAWEKDLKLELRKGTEHASSAGKGIAAALNSTGLTIDPRQVDYALRSYGGLGQISTGMLERNRGAQDTFLKATGLTADPSGTAARDVQWVLDWARQNGKLNDESIRNLQAYRKSILEEKDAVQRDLKSAHLRKYASRLRESIERRKK